MPWRDVAFARAKAEQKPVFLSIGYSTCHWCHVMAHESFENLETAALMNRAFVNIKVDRDVRLEIVPTPDGTSARRYMARAMRRRNPPGSLIFLWNKQPMDCDRVFDRLRAKIPRQVSRWVADP